MTMVGKCCLCGELSCTGCKLTSEIESWTMDFSPAMSYAHGLTATHSVTMTDPVFLTPDATLTQTRIYPELSSLGNSTPLTVPSNPGGTSGTSPLVGLVCNWGGTTGSDHIFERSALLGGGHPYSAENKACVGVIPTELSNQPRDGSWIHPYLRNHERQDFWNALPATCGESFGCGEFINQCLFYTSGMHYLLTAATTPGESGNKVDLELEMWFSNLVLELTDSTAFSFRAFIIGGAISSSSWFSFQNNLNGIEALTELISVLYPSYPNPGNHRAIEEVSAPARRSVLYAAFPDFQERQVWSATVDCSDLEQGSVSLELTREVRGWYTGIDSLWTAIGITNIPQTITLTAGF